MNKLESQHKVIVYGVDTQIGLSIIRELGEHGCQVIAIGKSPSSIGLKSRHVFKGYVLEGEDDETKVAFLHRVHMETQATYLMCISESDILFFNRVKGKLRCIKPLVPEQEIINKVLSKEYTAKMAKQIGIDTPRTWQLTATEQLNDILPQLSFPLILKWSNPHSVMSEASVAGLKLEKLIYCYSEAELKTWVDYYAPIKAWPMIQEYCKGQGLGQFFFMHEGKALLRFQHFRVHEWPPEGGFSTLCQSVPLKYHTELQEKSVALLNSIGWTGVAMVEYRFDPENERAVLMEINGRFWGSFPLAYHAGIPFAWYTYKVQGLNQLPLHESLPEQQILCRNSLVDFKRLLRIVFQREKINDKSLQFNVFSEVASFFLGYFNPSMRYFLFSLKDPGPFTQDIKNLIRKIRRHG